VYDAVLNGNAKIAGSNRQIAAIFSRKVSRSFIQSATHSAVSTNDSGLAGQCIICVPSTKIYSERQN
jgi:hypothetical protein